MNKNFFIKSDEARFEGTYLEIPFYCRCGYDTSARFSTRELLNGGTHKCAACGTTLELNGLSWNGRVRII